MCLPESATLKIERAQEHLDALRVAYYGHLALQPYHAIRQPSPEPGTQHFKFEIDPPVPPLGLYIGDFAHTLRSALDHVAVALTGDFEDRSIQFPIFSVDPDAVTDAKKRRKLRRKWADQIGKAPSPAQDVIKELQPYWSGDDPMGDPLWIIHELDIVDKHKMINVSFPGMPLMFSPDSNTPYAAKIWRIEDGNEIMFQGVDDDFEPTITGGIGFSWGKDLFIRFTVLSAIYEYVRSEVVPPLARLFPNPLHGGNVGPSHVPPSANDPRSKLLVRFKR